MRTMWVVVAAAWAGAAWGQTLDYYRFEDGTAGSAASVLTDQGPMARNGAVLSGAAAPVYSSQVPVAVVPQTGAPDTLSLSLASHAAGTFGYPFPFQTLKSATAELWVYPTSYAVSGSDVDFFWTTTAVNGGDANRFNAGIRVNGAVFLDYREPNGTLHPLAQETAGLVPLNAWTFIAFEKANNTYSIFVSGPGTHGRLKRVSRVADSAPNLPTNSGWTLNGRFVVQPLDCCQFTGLVDEIRLSKGALKTSALLISKGAPSRRR